MSGAGPAYHHVPDGSRYRAFGDSRTFSQWGRAAIRLGKAIKNDDDKIVYFKVGADDPNWQQPGLARSVWKFMADHVGHHLESVREFSELYDKMVADDPRKARTSKSATIPTRALPSTSTSRAGRTAPEPVATARHSKRVPCRTHTFSA